MEKSLLSLLKEEDRLVMQLNHAEAVVDSYQNVVEELDSWEREPTDNSSNIYRDAFIHVARRRVDDLKDDLHDIRYEIRKHFMSF